MAGGDELLGINGIGGVGAALLFIGSGTNVYDAFSAVMSSPWSTEKFTGNPEEEAMARQYVMHALVISWIYAGGGAALAWRSGGAKLAIWPIIGAGITTLYMRWLYRRALERAAAGSPQQQEPAESAPAPAPAPVEQLNNAITHAYIWGVPSPSPE